MEELEQISAVTSRQKKFLSNSVEDQAEIHKYGLWQNVVSIAQSSATWHYTMENLLGLASIDLTSCGVAH